MAVSSQTVFSLRSKRRAFGAEKKKEREKLLRNFSLSFLLTHLSPVMPNGVRHLTIVHYALSIVH